MGSSVIYPSGRAKIEARALTGSAPPRVPQSYPSSVVPTERPGSRAPSRATPRPTSYSIPILTEPVRGPPATNCPQASMTVPQSHLQSRPTPRQQSHVVIPPPNPRKQNTTKSPSRILEIPRSRCRISVRPPSSFILTRGTRSASRFVFLLPGTGPSGFPWRERFFVGMT